MIKNAKYGKEDEIMKSKGSKLNIQQGKSISCDHIILIESKSLKNQERTQRKTFCLPNHLKFSFSNEFKHLKKKVVRLDVLLIQNQNMMEAMKTHDENYQGNGIVPVELKERFLKNIITIETSYEERITSQ
ncbi:hypothetical protein Trydic_g6685 [Trypoxylus dichotomus]